MIIISMHTAEYGNHLDAGGDDKDNIISFIYCFQMTTG